MAFQKDLSHADWGEIAQRQAARLDLAREWITLAGIRAGSRVLDIGPGPGQFTREYAHVVGPTGTVYALEKAESAIDDLRRALDDHGLRNVIVRVEDAEHSVAIDGEVDAVMITDVLHHVDRPQAVLHNVAGVMTGDATLLIAEFDPAGDGRIGPPCEHRLGAPQIKQWLAAEGFHLRAEGRQAYEHYYLIAGRAPADRRR
jgi:ubiquinone/menaquinone biosynthesis C-methylase UbiE